MIVVKEILNADIYRDGGSRSFCFYSTDGEWYEFFMKIRREKGTWNGYLRPKLLRKGEDDMEVVYGFTWEESIEFVRDLEYDNDRFRELVVAVNQRGETKIPPTIREH